MTEADHDDTHDSVSAERRDTEVAAEQSRVHQCYARLDQLRAVTEHELDDVRKQVATGSHQLRSERDAFAALHERRLKQLWSVEQQLVFGRLDFADAEHLYVGRLGLSTSEDASRILVDWRAPAATSFYQATAARPMGVIRRRHIRLVDRTVDSLEDEVLNADAFEASDLTQLRGDGALMVALSASRTGQMRDIVSTIQSEQDRIIRDELKGILVVQGGPGTGKTAVALHRAAYLLYTHRDKLERHGVLVVGPSQVFLNYIEHVIPSLGETGVVSMTAGELFPGVHAHIYDPPDVAKLKGDIVMAQVVRNAVRDRQLLLDHPREFTLDGRRIVLHPRTIRRARDEARRSRKPHNEARDVFLKSVLKTVTKDVVSTMGRTVDDELRAEVEAEVREYPPLRTLLNRLWLPLTPQQLISRLIALPDRLEKACRGTGLTMRDQSLLWRDLDTPWTVDDIPLLDEAAELLGADEVAQQQQQAHVKQRQDDLEYADKVLDMIDMTGLVSREELANRFRESTSSITVAERAAADRTWTFGHVVVDEAQELSAMMWRLLVRRCPRRSMTVVGDLAQTRSAGGIRDWMHDLRTRTGGSVRVEKLTVNYRTPERVLDLATAVAAANGHPTTMASSVRVGQPPTIVHVVRDRLVPITENIIRARLSEDDFEGTIAVITPDGGTDRLAGELSSALKSTASVISGLHVHEHGMTADITVLNAHESKGLEFDDVLLIEPADIMAEPAGRASLYVGMTRPTQRLTVIHSRPLPEGFNCSAL